MACFSGRNLIGGRGRPGCVLGHWLLWRVVSGGGEAGRREEEEREGHSVLSWEPAVWALGREASPPQGPRLAHLCPRHLRERPRLSFLPNAPPQ